MHHTLMQSLSLQSQQGPEEGRHKAVAEPDGPAQLSGCLVRGSCEGSILSVQVNSDFPSANLGGKLLFSLIFVETT